MKWLEFSAVFLLLPALALAEPKQRTPRTPSTRPHAAEQTATEPWTVSRQGKYWVEEINGTVAAAPRVRIETLSGGNIELRGADQNDITYRIVKRVSASSEENARKFFAQFPVRVHREGDKVVLAVEPQRGRNLSADYYVTVPRRTTLADMETFGGSVSARDIEGSVRAQTLGGGIDVDGIGGEVRLETAGGGIQIGKVRGLVRAETAGGGIKLASVGGEAQLATQGGDIEVARAERSVRAETAGGGIRITSAGGDVTAETAGGNIYIGEAGRVIVATAGGSIQVDHARALVRAESAAGSIRLYRCAGPVRAETAAGSIQALIAASRAAWAESLLETAAGDIVVTLPRDLALTVQAAIEMANGRHRITSDFPLTQRSSEAPGRREISAQGTINGGGAPLHLRTVSGSIEIRSQK